MTTENKDAIHSARYMLQCVALQLETDLGVKSAFPISVKVLEAVQACDDALKKLEEK